MNCCKDKFVLATNLSSFQRDVREPGGDEEFHVPSGGDFDSTIGWIAYDDVVVFSKNFSEEDYIREMPHNKAFVMS